MPIRLNSLVAVVVLTPAALLAGSISACPADTLAPYLQNIRQNDFGAVFSSFAFSSSPDDQVMARSMRGETATAELPFAENSLEVHSLLNPGRDEMSSISFLAASDDPSPSGVPEPAPSALAAGGLFALGLVASKRRR
jgi:hypothetical protein